MTVKRQQVALVEGRTDCPRAPTGWTVTALGGGATLRPGMPWCIYRWPSATVAPDVRGLEDSLKAASSGSITPDDVNPDVLAVTPAEGPDIEEALTLAWREAFRARTGKLTLNPDYVGGTKVRLAILDSSADGVGTGAFAVDVKAPHGAVLANLAREALCPDGPSNCPVEIVTYQTLNTEIASDRAKWMGHVGSIATLAGNIRRAVDDWRESDTPHLVINLSLGWSPIWLKDLASHNRMVQDALSYARCHGALVFAAAGNAGSRRWSMNSRMVLPALWSDVAVNEGRCTEVWAESAATHPLKPAFAVDQPMLHAVGAVGLSGRDLGFLRERGQPPLIAVGEQAVAKDLNDTLLAPATGTSVSTLVVSAAASALWAKRSDLSPFDLELELFTKAPRASQATVTAPNTLGVYSALPGPALIDLCVGQPDAPFATWVPYYCSASPSAPPFVLPAKVQTQWASASSTALTYPGQQACSSNTTLYCEATGGCSADLCLMETLAGLGDAPSTQPENPSDLCPPCIAKLVAMPSQPVVDLVIKSMLRATSYQVELKLSNNGVESLGTYTISNPTTPIQSYRLTLPATSATTSSTLSAATLIITTNNRQLSLIPIFVVQ